MRSKNPESPKRTLYVGFGLLILLIVGMAVHDWWSRQVIKQRMDVIVQHYAAKERLIREMLHISRYRAMLMYEMLIEDDPFKRDEVTQHFRTLATDFYLKREQLEALGLDEEEKNFFDLAREHTRQRYLSQEQAVNLIEDGRIDAARQIIMEEAIPSQHPQLATLERLVDYQERRMDAVVSKAEQDFKHEQEAIIIISIAGGVIALLIAIFVIRETTALYRLAEQAKREAEGASKAKADFLARMSHEIRTPLNAINGMTELMQGTRVTQEQAGFLNIMRTSGGALMSLINDILDFSKIEAGKLELEHIPFSLRDCVLEALEIRASAAAAKGLTLSYWVDPILPNTVMGDPSRIRQVLINLIGNAVKFTGEGEVSLKVTRRSPGDSESPGPADGEQSESRDPLLVRFEVSDTGTGISNDKVQRLFSAYDQSDASISRRFGGTGLGLNISQFLVSEMGGRIGVKSDLGRGTVFSFVLPLAPDSGPTEPS
ncbi:MAG: ATP-binding protein, partial [Gammaproteobacteria bacterium]